MDWKSLATQAKNLTEKAKPFLDKTKKLAEKTAPIVKKAKGYGSSAIAFVGKQIESTPIFIKTEEEFDIHVGAKRSIFIAYDSRDAISESIRLAMPFWATQAWTDAADLKYLEMSTNEELSKTLKIVGPVEMRIMYMGEEYGRFHTLEDIREWWKVRNYIQGEDEHHSETKDTKNEENTMKDPITEVLEKPKAPRKKKTTNTKTV